MAAVDLAAAVADWPVGDAAVVVLGQAGELARHDSGARFRWASVTKIATALTVLDACADGVIGRDDPAGPAGSTVAHLLAHTSGLPFDGPAPAGRVGARRIYSNAGYEVVAQHLQDAAGTAFGVQMQRRVFDPLGMRTAVLDGSAASGGVGTLADLQLLAAELLQPQVFRPEIVSAASTVAFPGLTGVLPGFGRQAHNDWGMGCEIRDHKAPHWTSPDNSAATFGHFGQSGSFLWVDPVAGLACASLADTPFGPWAAEVWPRLSTAVLAAFG